MASSANSSVQKWMANWQFQGFGLFLSQIQVRIKSEVLFLKAENCQSELFIGYCLLYVRVSNISQSKKLIANYTTGQLFTAGLLFYIFIIVHNLKWIVVFYFYFLLTDPVCNLSSEKNTLLILFGTIALLGYICNVGVRNCIMYLLQIHTSIPKLNYFLVLVLCIY